MSQPDTESGLVPPTNAPSSPLRAKMGLPEMEASLKRLAPFHHAIELPFGLNTFIPEVARHDRERTRMRTLIDHAWPAILAACGGSLAGRRVLDIACNCGGFAAHAAQSGAEYVLGLDIDLHYIDQANFIRDALDLENLQFRKMDLLDLDPSEHGMFDLVLCFGILYHLENPVLSMKRIAAVSSGVLVVDTTLMKMPFISRLLDRWPLWHMRRVPGVEESAVNITTSRWRTGEVCQFSPNGRAVENLLEYSGFQDIRRLNPTSPGLEKRYNDRRRATFIARK